MSKLHEQNYESKRMKIRSEAGFQKVGQIPLDSSRRCISDQVREHSSMARGSISVRSRYTNSSRIFDRCM